MPATQSREELIENKRKSRIKMENGITYECALIEKIEYHSSYTMFKLKRKLDCTGRDFLRFESASPKRQEEIRKNDHVIFVNYKYFEDKNFDPYFEHNFGNHRVVDCLNKERFEIMVDEMDKQINGPALLALVETVGGLFGEIFK